MKKKILIATMLTLLINATAAPPANATDCKSLAQITGDIWQKWGTVIVAVGCGAAVVGGIVKPKTCLNSPKYAQAVEKMVAFFNEKVNNSWATIGPRQMEFGSTQEGNLIGPGDRVFLSPAPLDKDSITIKIKKLAGKAHTVVVICKINENNTQTKLDEFEFAEGDGNTGQEVTKTVSGVQNHLIQVHLDAKSLAKEFNYSFYASK